MHQPYVYIWRHTPSMKWYIGSRTAKKCHPEDGYICSSKRVKPMIKANPHEWEREILATGTREEMLEYEFELLDMFDAKNDPRSFNLHNGDGKFSMAGQVGARVGCAPWNKGLTKHDDNRIASVAEFNSINFKGKTPSNKGQKGHQAWNKGLTKETDERVAQNAINSGIASKGKIPWNKGLTKETSESIALGTVKMAESKKGKPTWNAGMKGVVKQSEETLAKKRARCEERKELGLTSKLKGTTRPDEIKKQISESLKTMNANRTEPHPNCGKPSWNKGISPSTESIAKGNESRRLTYERKHAEKVKLNEQASKGNDIGEDNR